MAFFKNFFAMPHYNIIVLYCALNIHSLKGFFLNSKLSFFFNTRQTRGLVFFNLSGLDTSISYIEMHMYVL